MKRITQLNAILLILVLMVSGCSSTSPATPITLAIWDFDGTIIEGDCMEGLEKNGKTIYDGTIAAWILSGQCEKYKGQDGAKQFFNQCQQKKDAGQTSEAYRDEATIFAGQDVTAFQLFCKNYFRELQKHYFVESIRKLRELQASGVEVHVISASPELVVRSAAESIGIPEENIHGVRLAIKNGKITDWILEPFPSGDGKILVMRQIERERNGKALYGFGNSYSTDGPFLLEIAKQGGKSVMINGGEPRPGMTEHFQCITLTQTFASRQQKETSKK